MLSARLNSPDDKSPKEEKGMYIEEKKLFRKQIRHYDLKL
jgi:hypothetical protein